MIEWIGFDADDTLWENEMHYRGGRELFDRLLSDYVITDPIGSRVNEIEIENLQYYGFGAPGFILSLLEAANELTDMRFGAQDSQALIEYLKQMLSAKTQLIDGAR